MTELRSVDLNLLVALDALLQEHSVTRAAGRLGLSTPAMSHALARLRKHLADPVLVRAGRQMVPSPRAQELGPLVRQVVEGARSVFAATGPFDPARCERTFVIHATDYVLVVMGTELDQRVRAEAPSATLRFLPNTATDAEAIRNGDIDLAVGVYQGLPPEVRIQRLFEERLVCAVRHDHPRIRKRLSLERYLAGEHVQIAPRGQPGGYVDAVLAKRGHRRRVARAVPYFFAGVLMASRTDYILTVPQRLVHCLAPGLGLRIVEPPLPFRSYTLVQIWHPRHDADPAHAWLRRQVHAAATASAPPRKTRGASTASG